MRWVVLAVVTASVVALGACTTKKAGPSSAPNPSSSSGIKGFLTYVGGPASVASPSSPHLEPGSVTAFSTDGNLPRVRAVFSEGEGFSLPLPPGDYQLVGRSGDAHCRAQTVTVPPDRFVVVTIACDVK